MSKTRILLIRKTTKFERLLSKSTTNTNDTMYKNWVEALETHLKASDAIYNELNKRNDTNINMILDE